MLDEPADVEDALQETFLDAWKGLSGFRGDAALQTWLTLARRRCYAHLRRIPESGSRPHVSLDDVTDRLPARGAEPAGLHLAQDLVAALDAALRMLPRGNVASGSSGRSRTSPTLTWRRSWPSARMRCAGCSSGPVPRSQSL